MVESGRRGKEKHSGFNIHWFSNKEKASEYRCGICTQVLDDPRQVVSCGHQFCKLCLPDKVEKCPECSKEVAENQVFPDESVKQKVLSLKMKCPAKRCKWKGPLKNYRTHAKECPCELVICTNKDCHERVERAMLVNHQEKECKYRNVQCRHCGQTIVLASEKRHDENDCLRIPIKCSQTCGQMIPKEEINRHIDDDCEKTKVDCVFNNVGCTERVERREIENHKHHAMQHHLHLTMLAVRNINVEKERMAQEVDQQRTANQTMQNELRDLREAQEKHFGELKVYIEKIEVEGAIQLEGAQKATEQNFENLSLLVNHNGEIQNAILLLQGDIEKQHGLGRAQQLSIHKLVEQHDRLCKKTISIHHLFTKALMEQRTVINTRLDELSQQQKEDWLKVTEFQEMTKEKLVRLDHITEENKTELGTQKTALHIVKDDAQELSQNVSTQMERDYENLAGMISKEVQAREKAFRQLDKAVTQLEVSCMNSGCFVWRIEAVEAALKVAKVDPNDAKYGQAFFSEPNGYLLRPKLFFNGARKKDRFHISIFVQLMKGQNDGVLQWPFNQRVRFTLIDQQQDPRLRRNVSKVILPNSDAEELQRPTEEVNNGYGIYKFVEQEVLHAREYVVDDTMFIRVEVLANDDQDGHSETI